MPGQDDASLSVSLVIENKAFVAGLKEAERGAATTGKKIKDDAEKGGVGFDVLGKKVLKAGLAFVGLQSAEGIIGRIVQHSEALKGAMEEIFSSLGGRLDETVRALGGADHRFDAQKQAVQAFVAEAAKAGNELVRIDNISKDLRGRWEGLMQAMEKRAGGAEDFEETRQELERLGFTVDTVKTIIGRAEEEARLNAAYAALAVEAKKGHFSLTLLAAALDEVKARAAEQEDPVKKERERLKVLRDLAKAQEDLKKSEAIDVGPLFSESATDVQQLGASISATLRDMGYTSVQAGNALADALDVEKVKLFTLELKAAAQAYGLNEDQVQALAGAMQRLREETKAAAEEEAKLARRESWDGFRDGVSASLEEMRDLEAVGKDVANGMRDQFSETFQAFVAGTFDAKAALGSLLQLVAKIFGNLGAGQLTSGLGSALGFGGGKASGGSVSAGTAYLVGEDGPEIFRAPGNGTIIPARQSAQLLGGNTVNAPVTIHYTAAGGSSEDDARRLGDMVTAHVMRQLATNMRFREAVRGPGT